MIAIVCIDKNRGIGKNDKLLYNIPDDMKHFRDETRDSIVVMGRKTLFTFKDKAPLKNRINIVFTNNEKLKDEYKDYNNIFFVRTENELNSLLDKYKDKKAFLIGGAKLYNDLIDKCDECIITEVDSIKDADTFFPDVYEHGFKKISESENFSFEDINYKFVRYKK